MISRIKTFIILLSLYFSNAGAQTFTSPITPEFKFAGIIGERLKANLENWELPAPAANPAIIEMFYDRDRLPSRQPLPWSGEFIGKYLCSSILSYRILKDPRQKAQIMALVKKFIASQGEDGYLGAFDSKQKLTGSNWDIWNHYWAIRALLLYYSEFNDAAALNSATRAADMLTDKFLNKNIHLTNDGSLGQMNYAIIHGFTQLYKVTKKPSYLEMANWVTKEWEIPGAGRYISMATDGYEMHEFPGNRWESLHDFLGMYDMYLLTGEEKYKKAFTHIWYSILKGDRHNTGGFTTGERTTGDPYAQGAIETCCTVAWIDMTIDMLKLTGSSLVADELELSTYNGLLGSQTPSGRWWTYNTPMDGAKRASAHDINFQCRPGSPELNCCSVNGPRGLSMISEWALLKTEKGTVLNFYGPGSLSTKTPKGKPVTFKQVTEYPKKGKINISVETQTPEQFELMLRIPAWSQKTVLTLNGLPLDGVVAGSYYTVSREWKKGDEIEVNFDMSIHYWQGAEAVKDKASIYYGPLLLSFDPVYNKMDADKLTPLKASGLKLAEASTDRAVKPLVLFSVEDRNGNKITLCDFMTAGAYGNNYISWLPVEEVQSMEFSKEKPIWNNRSVKAR